MTKEQTNNWEDDFDNEFWEGLYSESNDPTGIYTQEKENVKQFISKTISQEREKCFKETVKAIFSGETVEYEGTFFKISDSDALKFLNLLQK